MEQEIADLAVKETCTRNPYPTRTKQHNLSHHELPAHDVGNASNAN